MPWVGLADSTTRGTTLDYCASSKVLQSANFCRSIEKHNVLLFTCHVLTQGGREHSRASCLLQEIEV